VRTRPLAGSPLGTGRDPGRSELTRPWTFLLLLQLYIFSKETLQADAAEVIAALEIKKVPPAALSLSASSASLASASTALGQTLDTHVYPLVDSLHTQSRALVLAASNLSLHLASLAGFHTSLGPLAAREFARQRELLASYRAALWVVERIAVDKRLFSGKTKDGERKLGDYVNLKKMAVVEEGCVKLEGLSRCDVACTLTVIR
jgi:hypothetical protein